MGDVWFYSGSCGTVTRKLHRGCNGTFVIKLKDGRVIGIPVLVIF